MYDMYGKIPREVTLTLMIAGTDTKILQRQRPDETGPYALLYEIQRQYILLGKWRDIMEMIFRT